jgi:hypothetical protein
LTIIKKASGLGLTLLRWRSISRVNVSQPFATKFAHLEMCTNSFFVDWFGSVSIRESTHEITVPSTRVAVVNVSEILFAWVVVPLEPLLLRSTEFPFTWVVAPLKPLLLRSTVHALFTWVVAPQLRVKCRWLASLSMHSSSS